METKCLKDENSVYTHGQMGVPICSVLINNTKSLIFWKTQFMIELEVANLTVSDGTTKFLIMSICLVATICSDMTGLHLLITLIT